MQHTTSSQNTQQPGGFSHGFRSAFGAGESPPWRVLRSSAAQTDFRMEPCVAVGRLLPLPGSFLPSFTARSMPQVSSACGDNPGRQPWVHLPSIWGSLESTAEVMLEQCCRDKPDSCNQEESSLLKCSCDGQGSIPCGPMHHTATTLPNVADSGNTARVLPFTRACRALPERLKR